MTARKRSRLPAGVTSFVDRHGKRRYRFRRKGQHDHYFKADFGTHDWQLEYDACVSGVDAPKIEPGKGRYKAGTFDALILRYYHSPEFTGLASTTKPNVRNILERFRKAHGTKPVRLMERRHIKAIIGAMSATPSAANNLLDRIKVLMLFAMDEGIRKDNPALGIRGFKITSPGFHTWTEEEIAKFEAKHPVGSKARLAFALLLYTAQRRSDVVRMGWQHVSGNHISVVQSKTKAALALPIHPELRLVLDGTPRTNMTFLVTEYGKPFAVAGFGNWFRQQCDLAGLPHCSAHGLRKAQSRRMAEGGKTNQQIKAVTGHRTDKEVARYTAAADQRRLADQALRPARRRKTGTNLANQAEKGSQNDQ